jgi:hypothetical protein
MMKTIVNLFLLSSLLLSTGCSAWNTAKADKEGFISIFDGKTLDGWDYDPTYWSVEKGCIVGTVTPETILRRNTFLINRDLIVGDFELKVEYRVSEGGNSGVSYRNERVDGVPHALRGYQADIDGLNLYTGQNYEERGREFLAVRGQRNTIEEGYVSPSHSAVVGMDLKNDTLSRHIRRDEWNEYHIIAVGGNIKHIINGVTMSEITDNDAARRRMYGLVGVQVHVGPPMKIEYKNFRVKPLSGDNTTN